MVRSMDDADPATQQAADGTGEGTSAFLITAAASQRMSELADRLHVLSEDVGASADAMLAAWHAGFNAAIDGIAEALRHYARQSRLPITENWSPATDSTRIVVGDRIVGELPHSNVDQDNTARAFVGDMDTWVLELRWPYPLSAGRVIDLITRQTQAEDCSKQSDWTAGLERISQAVEWISTEHNVELARTADGAYTLLQLADRATVYIAESSDTNQPTVGVVTSQFRWILRYPTLPDVEVIVDLLRHALR